MIGRLVALLCYLAAACVILTFIFSNREAVSINLFPLAATAEMPLYLALCFVFATGLILGLFYSFTVWVSMRGRVKRAERAANQLEKEVAAKSQTSHPVA